MLTHIVFSYCLHTYYVSDVSSTPVASSHLTNKMVEYVSWFGYFIGSVPFFKCGNIASFIFKSSCGLFVHLDYCLGKSSNLFRLRDSMFGAFLTIFDMCWQEMNLLIKVSLSRDEGCGSVLSLEVRATFSSKVAIKTVPCHRRTKVIHSIVAL